MSTSTQIPKNPIDPLSEGEKTLLNTFSRRQFLKIGVMTVGAVVIGEGALQILPLQKSDLPLSNHLPTRNPAFLLEPERDGYWLCYTNDKVSGRRLVYRLNHVGAEIYQACDGKQSPHQIATAVAEKLQLSAPGFVDATDSFLSVLEKYDLVVTRQKVNQFYNTVVRYERA